MIGVEWLLNMYEWFFWFNVIFVIVILVGVGEWFSYVCYKVLLELNNIRIYRNEIVVGDYSFVFVNFMRCYCKKKLDIKIMVY